MPVLRARQFPIAFDFARGEAAAVRGPDGVVRTLAPDLPRFDHDPDGTPRGLLVTEGEGVDGRDRAQLDPMMLPADMVEGDELAARATVYHAFVPLAASGTVDGISTAPREDFDAAIVWRAIYTRDAAATIDALLREDGHHLAIGTHAGFAESRDGFVRFRGRLWQLQASS
ncbi:hypothetical protein ACLBKU_17480 [Erythrobacter sp. NE805]|uniref:hypothetical protein n=1 Tax=Erythrobacter sp. NE805 TaxID=3389875 RepID=UPI00396B38B4